MLNVFRKASKTWVAKILFGLLVLSFAIWGVGDMVSVGVGNKPAIVAGNIEIPADAVAAEYKREVTRLQRVFGNQFTEEQARSMGLLERTIDNMVARALLDQAAADFDMVAPDAVVRQRIAANPAFHNQLGQFDPQVFRQAITQAGFTEPMFVAMARKDLTRGQLLDATTHGMRAPTPVAEALFQFRQEKRVAETITVEASAMPAPPTPDDATLTAFWEANKQRFMAPEFRAVTALVLRPGDVAGDVQVTDAMVEEAYRQRLSEFQEPERRNVRQILFSEEGAARKAAEQMQAGKDMAAVVEGADQQVLELGWVDRQSLEALAPQLAETVFTTDSGKVAPPVQTSLGWHLVQVSAVQAGKGRALPEVRDQLVQDLVNEKSIDRLYELANKVEDTLASGTSLEEAAEKLSLRVVKTDAVDARGNGIDGKPLDTLPKSQKFLDVAFVTAEGQEARMSELENNGGFFIARVDKVTPPAAKPFETVRVEVQASWQAEQQLAAARAAAGRVAERLRAGEAVAAVAESVGAQPQKTPPFTRQAFPPEVPAELAVQIFKSQLGDIVMASSPKGAVVAKLDQVVAADPKADAAAYAEMRNALGEGYAADIIDQMVAALNAAHKATIDRQAIESRLR